MQLGFKQWQNRAKKAEQDLKLLEQSNQQKTSSNQLKSQLEKMKSDHAVVYFNIVVMSTENLEIFV